MSDDLISRKAAYKAFSDYLNRNFLGEISPEKELRVGEIASVIKSIPAVFDKEKVIEELRAERNPIYREDGSLMSDRTYISINKAIEIVEKGGIG